MFPAYDQRQEGRLVPEDRHCTDRQNVGKEATLAFCNHRALNIIRGDIAFLYQLPDGAREWDRSAVHSIPSLLASVNLAVVK